MSFFSECQRNSGYEMRNLNMSQILEMAFTNFSDFRYNFCKPLYCKENLIYHKISDFYKSLLLDWLDNYNDIYMVRFEKLVGQKGGGSKEEQVEEIINLAAQLGEELSVQRAEEIGSQLFGGTMTFRRGVIGCWMSVFNNDHKSLFKSDMGEILKKLGYVIDDSW